MLDKTPIPLEARCLTCGYLLRGLPEPVCPECGRRFDPLAPSTFDTKPPEQRRRRRWVKRGGALLCIALLAFAFLPRRILQGTITFTCTRCGQSTAISRWELKPPRWIPFRYPGFRRVSKSSPPNPATMPACDPHRYNLRIRFDMHMGGSCAAFGSYTPGETYTVNGQLLTLTTAPSVLESLMSPSNNGIGP